MHQSHTPLVSVVMTVYDGERFLAQAVESILRQTFSDFEFIIVDDGSADNTPAILGQYARRDPRISIHTHPDNQGLIASLNWGFQLARGNYIARMDADDVSLPQRLSRQVAYLEQHPEVGIVGCLVRYIDEGDNPRSGFTERPHDPALVKWTLSFYCCLEHPAVLLRRDLIDEVGLYDPEFLLAEDYDLFLRASHVTRLANLRQTLLKVRHWGKSTSRSGRQHQLRQDTLLTQRAFSHWLGAEISAREARNLSGLAIGKYPANLTEIRQTGELLTRLRLAFIADPSLNASDIRAINLDASLKLWLLASRTLKHSVTETLSLSRQAMRIHPFGFVMLSGRLFRRATAFPSS